MTVRGERAVRGAILEVARAMSESGLSPGRSGNVSMRWKDGMLITPSAMPYDAMELGDIVLTNAEGIPAKATQRPSSEWRFHLAALAARPDCDAVVHTHSLHATALACAGKRIPAFHYMVAVAGGTDIPIVPYALFGTEALSDHVAEGLKNRNACLLANHGQVALGASPGKALELAQEVETLAAQYIAALQVGKPKLLSKAQMAAVLEQFSDYGAHLKPRR